MTAFRNGQAITDVPELPPDAAEKLHFDNLWAAARKRDLRVSRLGFDCYQISGPEWGRVILNWVTHRVARDFLDLIKLTPEQEERAQKRARNRSRQNERNVVV